MQRNVQSGQPLETLMFPYVSAVFRLPEQEMTQALKGATFRYKTAWEHAVFKPETRDNSCVFYIFALLQESPMWAWHKERG